MAFTFFTIVDFLLITFFNIALIEAAPSRSTSSRNIVPRQDISSTGEASPCAPIFTPSEDTTFFASAVYDCLKTVPLNVELGTQLITYFKDSLTFQSSVNFLADPPKSYQQPPVNLYDELDKVQTALDGKAYDNHYDFEVALQRVIYSAHEHHLRLYAGLTTAFTFGSRFAISSVSTDGKELPKPYFTDDLYGSQKDGDWVPSAIGSINGEAAVEWLSKFAANNSEGLIEPHADWNQMMYNPAGDVQYFPTSFTGQSFFYPGDKLNFEFENGTEVKSRWLALVELPVDAPSIRDGNDVYNYYVLGQLPEVDAETQAAEESAPSSKRKRDVVSSHSTLTPREDSQPKSWDDAVGVSGYPNNPFIVQKNLGLGGSLTAYKISDDVAVLSVPSFEMSGASISGFSTIVTRFIKETKEAGIEKVIIDLQQNYGGDLVLATDMFKQFFPPIEPYGGSRMRVSFATAALSRVYTDFWKANYKDTTAEDELFLVNLPWAALSFIDAKTGRNFSDYLEFFGPNTDHGQMWTTVQQNNISSAIFNSIETADSSADGDSGDLGAGLTISGYGNRRTKADPPFKAENIVLLTDGICSSACSQFVEMMKQQGGVRTVAVGGQPSQGPMQAVAGSRGALKHFATDLDMEIFVAHNIEEGIENVIPKSHLSETLDVWVQDVSFNLRDAVRKDENIPLQFIYEAADCRIYWTMKSFNDFSALWQDAADAIWNNGACVKDSTKFSSKKTDTTGPSEEQKAAWGGPTKAGSKLRARTNNYDPSPDLELIKFAHRELPLSSRGKVVRRQRGAKLPVATKAPPAAAPRPRLRGGLGRNNNQPVPARGATLPRVVSTLHKSCDASTCQYPQRCVQVTSGCVPVAKFECKLDCSISSSLSGCGSTEFCHLDFPQCQGNEACNRDLVVGSGSSQRRTSQTLQRANPSGFCEIAQSSPGVCWAVILRTALPAPPPTSPANTGGQVRPDFIVPADGQDPANSFTGFTGSRTGQSVAQGIGIIPPP